MTDSECKAPFQSKEKIYIVDWEGPHDLESLAKELKSKDYGNDYREAWSLYALTDNHPLYGEDVIVYIGMTTRQDVEKRLKQHRTWWEGNAYLACVYNNVGWDQFEELDATKTIRFQKNDDLDLSDRKKKTEDEIIIEKIEALLIYALSPAYNSRNKNTAENSKHIRIFNVGNTANIPKEISGLYNIGIDHIEQSPNPEAIDENSER